MVTGALTGLPAPLAALSGLLSPRRREHQETAVRAWLDSRATIRSGQQQVA